MKKTIAKDDDRFLFNTKNIAEILGVTYDTIEKWKLPSEGRIGKDKREVYYDIRKVVQARVEKFGNSATKQLNEEQAELAKIRREILELEFAERCGELVRVNEVRTKIFNIARTFRDSVLSIPSRLSSILAAETNERRINNQLTDEITQSLKCLQNPYK